MQPGASESAWEQRMNQEVAWEDRQKTDISHENIPWHEYEEGARHI